MNQDGIMDILPFDQELLMLAKYLLDNIDIVSRAKMTTNINIIDGKVAAPDRWENDIELAAKKSLVRALMRALMTFDGSNRAYFSSDLLYKKLDEAAGTTDHSYGVIEYITDIRDFTFYQIQQIGDIAKSCGELLWTSEAQIACMVVFVLGVPKIEGDKIDSAYFTIRDELAKSVNESISLTAEKGLTQEAIPALAEFINELVNRFETIVRLKIDTDIGLVHADFYRYRINRIFCGHFHDMSHGHFFVRYLERKYTPEIIRSEYNKINQEVIAKLFSPARKKKKIRRKTRS